MAILTFSTYFMQAYLMLLRNQLINGNGNVFFLYFFTCDKINFNSLKISMLWKHSFSDLCY